jgi:hypothetical protein
LTLQTVGTVCNGYKITANEGNGIYDTNNFVFFSCIDKLFSRKIHSRVTLFFNSQLLFNKSFYVSTVHSSSPHDLGEWVTSDHKMYKRKYNRYYKNYNKVLQKLFDQSISYIKNGDAFQIFQQIAVLNKVNLKKLVAIEFNIISKPNSTLINYLNKNYPKIIIKINKIRYFDKLILHDIGYNG